MAPSSYNEKLLIYASAEVRARAETIGAEELMNLLEWRLRQNPDLLAIVRKQYSDFCSSLLLELESYS
jgi:hypothetical protein